ncbi:hypothetical protein D3C84_904630 [compost metagenome]
MREAGGHATGDHGDTADGQGRDTVEGGDGEGAVLGQRRGIRCAAVAEVFLENGELATLSVQTANRDRVIVVVDLQLQVRGSAVAVRIGDGVGKGFAAIATAVQGYEIGIAGVQRVGVGAVGVEHQGAVSAGEGARGDRSSVFTDRHAVGALHVVSKHVAVEGQ